VGAPVKSFYLRLTSKDGETVTAHAGPNADGKLHIDGLAPTEWNLHILDRNGRTELHQERVTLTAGATKELSIVTKGQ